jgi:tryptophan synthase alpha chain
MPYLMGGFPDVEASVRIGEAYADAGADLVELGVPFSDPLADGRSSTPPATRALAAGATLHHVLEVGARLAQPLPVVLMCYANPCSRAGVSASRTSSPAPASAA